MILGIDAGNYTTKTVGYYGVDSYRTSICDWFDRFVKEDANEDDMEFEIGERKGFAGTIAEHEEEFGVSSMYGDTKAHDDTKIRILLAIYRYIKKYDIGDEYFSIVIGQPVAKHNDEEKGILKRMIEGYHEYTVNDERMHITIESVTVAPEGAAAFWTSPKSGLVRILDVGSGTVNAVSLKDGKIINNATNTLNFGVETARNKSGIVRGIIRNTSVMRWGTEDKVEVCGGVAEEVVESLRTHFKNCEAMIPRLDDEPLHSVYANAVGFYKIAKRMYENE